MRDLSFELCRRYALELTLLTISSVQQQQPAHMLILANVKLFGYK